MTLIRMWWLSFQGCKFDLVHLKNQTEMKWVSFDAPSRPEEVSHWLYSRIIDLVSLTREGPLGAGESSPNGRMYHWRSPADFAWQNGQNLWNRQTYKNYSIISSKIIDNNMQDLFKIYIWCVVVLLLLLLFLLLFLFFFLFLLCVVCCLLFVACCLLFVVCCLLVVGCWLLVVCCLLFVGCCLLVVGCWLLVVGCWLLFVVCWLLVVCCWLFVAVVVAVAVVVWGCSTTQVLAERQFRFSQSHPTMLETFHHNAISWLMGWLVISNIFLFFHILGRILLTDELIFFRGVGLNHQPGWVL